MTRLQHLAGLAFGLLAICVLSIPAIAQFRSSIEGTVTDATGAVVPDAQITLTNVDTGIVQAAKTNGDGLFRFPSLPPGRYKVTAAKQGFATTTQENITLLAEEILSVPLSLKTGNVSEVVTVTEDVSSVQFTESKVAGDITSEEITELPLAGRNIGNLISQIPGVTGVGNASQNANDTDIFSLVNNPQVNANGQRGDANAFYVDNTLATSNPDPGVFNLTPNPESVQELHVAVNDYSAEYGRSSSLVIQAISKTGTNNFHGSLFEYHQDNRLTARNALSGGQDVPVFRRNEFGGSLGGPIIRNRLFGFFSFDKKLASTPVVYQDTVETPDFVSFMKKNYPNNLSTKLMTQFPATINGVVPGTLQTVNDIMGVDPNTGASLCLEKGPAVPGMPCSLPIRQTTTESFAGTTNGLQWNTRVDLSFDKDRFYTNFYRKTPYTQGINTRPDFASPNNFAGITNYANLDWTHTFSPNMVNDAAMGITRISGLGTCSNCQVPSIAGMGIAAFGDGFAPAEFVQNDFQWRDLLSINHGKHGLKLGFDIFRDQENDLFDGPTQRPGYGFGVNPLTGSLDPIFDFALDQPLTEGAINYDLRSGALSQQSIGYRSTNFGFFGQDDWKVMSNLSINFGLRWDFNTSPNEVGGRMSEVVLGSGSSLQERIGNASVAVVPTLVPNNRIAYFAPRLSFAWDPTKRGKLSIRGGMGVFFDRAPNIFWSDAIRANPPFIASVTADASVPGGPQPVYGICALSTNPFNCPIPPPAQLPTGLNTRGGALNNASSIGGVDPGVKEAYSISRFFGVQYEIRPSWLVEADYTGSQSVHLYVRTERNRCVGCFDPVSGTPTGFSPNPFFRGISYGDNSAWAHSNGATFSLLHRFSSSFSFQAAYTISKTTSIVDAPGLGRDSLLSPVYDPYNLDAQRGPASFDIPKAFTMHGIWELPRLGNRHSLVRGVLGGWQLTGALSLQSGYPFTVVDCTHSPTGNGGSCLLPSVAANVSTQNCNKASWLGGCLDANSFSIPTNCTINANNLLQCSAGGWEGNAGRNTFRGPGYADVDMSSGKYFRIPWFLGKEGARLQVRGEFFNILNRTNLNSISTDLSLVPDGRTPDASTGKLSRNANFGRAQGAYNPRTIQVGVRIEF